MRLGCPCSIREPATHPAIGVLALTSRSSTGLLCSGWIAVSRRDEKLFDVPQGSGFQKCRFKIRQILLDSSKNVGRGQKHEGNLCSDNLLDLIVEMLAFFIF